MNKNPNNFNNQFQKDNKKVNNPNGNKEKNPIEIMNEQGYYDPAELEKLGKDSILLG